MVSIYCFRATDYSQDAPAVQDGAANTALEQAEEVAAQADSQYEDEDDENEVPDEDTPDDDIDDDDGDDGPDTHVNGQAPLL